MKIFNFTFSLKNAIILSLFLFGIVFVASFLMVGSNEIFNNKTLLILITLLFFLGVITIFSSGDIFAQNVVIVGFFLNLT